ncbi:MAG TPA: endopeptidase La [Bdellovibrionota bacterium]|jgi:ATP-dependent Lon protease|nr:endopeptidase La [Bdellovibrionota bacterium]
MAVTKKKKSTTKAVSKSSSSSKQIVPLLPLRDIIIFPHMVVPFFVGREKSINALETAMRDKTDILLCAQRNSQDADPSMEEIFHTGTLANIMQLVKLPDGTLKVLVEGKKRAKIMEVIQSEPCVLCEVDELAEEQAHDDVKTKALVRSLKKAFETYVKLNKRISAEVLMSIESIDDASRSADSIAAHLSLSLENKQAILEIFDPVARLEKLLSILESEIEILQVERRIRSRVRKQMERGQKEYYLNEQMAAIQKELGEQDEFKAEINELEEKIKHAGFSTEAREKAEAEMRKLKMMAPMSAEATVIRNYLETLIELPWKSQTKDNLDLDHAQGVLDDDHYGLEKIKERITEFVAVQNLNPDLKGPILCLVGPPGVGKTSLGESIARALERKFVRVALGGVRDEAEIRGHRKTYVGAMPGKLISAVRKAGTKNPLILFDEIDKMGSDFRGDPASAMLEVLDPAQNSTFTDHFLEVEWDLSSCLFLCTANNLSSIPQPLIDRMEVIYVPSYTEEEKLQIATKYLLPKQLKNHGLKESQVAIQVDALLELIRTYTREAGVRNLEREVATLVRKGAKKYLQQPNAGTKTKKSAVKIHGTDLHEYLGPKRYKFGTVELHSQIGLTTGLAWTEVGGETLQIEVAILPGSGKLTNTGKLGDVMQESAQAAYTYVRSRAQDLGLPRDFYKNIDIHIHIPEGAVPKDGPSAGITMTTSLVSALTMRPVKKDVAMTGEITLRGNVLPIGGLKEKLLAAHRAGIKTVVIPEENEKDLYDVPKEILAQLQIYSVSHVDQVLKLALDIDTSSDSLITALAKGGEAKALPVGSVSRRDRAH